MLPPFPKTALPPLHEEEDYYSDEDDGRGSPCTACGDLDPDTMTWSDNDSSFMSDDYSDEEDDEEDCDSGRGSPYTACGDLIDGKHFLGMELYDTISVGCGTRNCMAQFMRRPYAQ